MEQNEEASKVFKLNNDKNPNVLTTKVGLGRAYSAIGDYKKALACMKAALPAGARCVEQDQPISFY